MAKRAYGLIIFDLDGTLIDSRQDIANSINFALGSVGLAPLSETDAKPIRSRISGGEQ